MDWTFIEPLGRPICCEERQVAQDSDKLEKCPEGQTGSVEVIRLTDGAAVERLADQVVLEAPITVMVDKLGSFTIMATPSDLEVLAVGFIFSEGLIDDIDDVIDISTKPAVPNVVGVRILNPARVAHQRNMIVASSCGMCGTRNVEKLFSNTSACGNTLVVSTEFITDMIRQMQSGQCLFESTGGSHAAAIFDASGQLITLAEDLGRHSALDKAIGRCLMKRFPLRGCAAALSGRVSLEMVTKAARAGLELIAGVSAPSSLAVSAADRWNITLCGFVRPGRTNVYTCPGRIKGL